MDRWEYLEVQRYEKADYYRRVETVKMTIYANTELQETLVTKDRNEPNRKWRLYLDGLGNQGWGLVTVEGGSWFCKRRKQ